MTWTSFILTGLKIILGLIEWRRSKAAMDAGEDKAVAEMAMKVLNATAHGKILRQRIKGMTNDESDQLWKDMLNEG